MQHAPNIKPRWATLADETQDVSFEWAEWASDADADLECTFFLKQVDVEVDHINPDRDCFDVTTLELAGASISERGLTTYHDRENVMKLIGYENVAAFEDNLLDNAIHEVA